MSKVLVLDDNEILVTVVTEALQEAGYDVMGTKDSKNLEKILQNQSFDLLITDIIMPDKEGIEIIIHVRENYSNMKVLAISGKDMGGSFNILELASGIGADATLKKPFTNSELIKTVNNLLG